MADVKYQCGHGGNSAQHAKDCRCFECRSAELCKCGLLIGPFQDRKSKQANVAKHRKQCQYYINQCSSCPPKAGVKRASSSEWHELDDDVGCGQKHGDGRQLDRMHNMLEELLRHFRSTSNSIDNCAARSAIADATQIVQRALELKASFSCDDPRQAILESLAGKASAQLQKLKAGGRPAKQPRMEPSAQVEAVQRKDVIRGWATMFGFTNSECQVEAHCPKPTSCVDAASGGTPSTQDSSSDGDDCSVQMEEHLKLKSDLASLMQIVRHCVGAEAKDGMRAPQWLRYVLREVNAAFTSGAVPKLTVDGQGGTYLCPNSDGKILGVFKPFDEEVHAPHNPRKLVDKLGTDSYSTGIYSGTGADREVMASVLDNGWAGVPRTGMAVLKHPAFSYHDDPVSRRKKAVSWKAGSFQLFIDNLGSMEEGCDVADLSATSIQRLAILDIRTAQRDRNGRNILRVKRADDEALVAVPIDHGRILPDRLNISVTEIVWMSYPQVKIPTEPELIEYVFSLDAQSDASTLIKFGFEPNVARLVKVVVTLLQACTSRGLTIYEIGTLMYRTNVAQPSLLEVLVANALSECFGQVVEAGRPGPIFEGFDWTDADEERFFFIITSRLQRPLQLM